MEKGVQKVQKHFKSRSIYQWQNYQSFQFQKSTGLTISYDKKGWIIWNEGKWN